MKTISVVSIIGEEEEFVEACVRSAMRIADEIILVYDPKARDATKDIITELARFDDRIKIIMHKWVEGSDQKHYAMKQATKDWILFLDSDEILDDEAPTIIKETIENNKDFDAFAIKGHHYIYNLGLEDASLPEHYWVGRLVKNTDNLSFKKGQQHAILEGYKKQGQINKTCVHHYGYCKNVQRVMNMFLENMMKRQLHSPEFLVQWKNSHIMGTYPVKPCTVDQHPRLIREKFQV